MNGWTDGDERWRALYYGESMDDRPDEPEAALSDREEPEAEAAPEEPAVAQAESGVPTVPDRVRTFEFTGAQWDAFLARACTPQHDPQTEPRAGRVA